jgi:hypothetical protein
MRKSFTIIIAAMAIVGLSACGSSAASNKPETNAVQVVEQANSRNASLACDHFRNIVGDVSKGVLTVGELREKLKEVDDNASIAPVDVQLAATELLSTVTRDDADGFLIAMSSMDTACTVAGS